MTLGPRPTFRVLASDGWPLVVERIAAIAPARGVVVCGHAMMCNRRTLDRPRGAGLGSALAEGGFHVYLVDLRGHGESGPAASRTVRFDYDDFVLKDLPALITTIAARHPDLPLALVGHSLTAHTGVATLGAVPGLPVRAMVSLGGNVWIPRLEPDPLVWAQKRARLEAWGVVSRLTGRFEARRLRFGTDDESLDYVLQFVHNARKDRWGSRDGRYDYLAAMRSLTLPLLSVTATGDDDLCRPSWAEVWLAHAVRAQKTTRVVGTHPGDPTGVSHMGLVTDPRMTPIWREIAAWLTKALDKVAAGS